MSAWPGVRTIALAMLLAVVAHWAAAQTVPLSSFSVQPHGFVATRPNAAIYSRGTGLALEVDSRWINNYGYRPIRVRVFSAKPVARDFRVTIRMHVAAWDWRSGDVTIEKRFDLPTGAKEAETIISCPQMQVGNRYWWDVSIDGKKEPMLSVDANSAWQLTAANNTTPGDVALKFLLVGSNSSQSIPAAVPNAEAFEAVVMPIDRLPTRWVDFTSVDVLALAPQDLEKLSKERPETLVAIGDWIRAGGQVWISPVGRKWESLGKVEALLGIVPKGTGQQLSANAKAGDATLAARGWMPIKLGAPPATTGEKTFIYLPTGQTRTFRDQRMIDRLENNPDWTLTDQVVTPPTDAKAQAKLPSDSSEWYVQRPMGLGYVRVFREAWDPVGFGISWQLLRGLTAFDPSETAPLLTTPLSAALETTRNWESRHGMTPDTANSDFADWLIPGVGQAPVTEFRVLITLFVLLIGPLNYWLLHRTQRLHLLVLTVPVTAAALTVALFGYALASDGLGTKVRVRSFTTLDQRTGDAACWARLSYYAGLAPGRGLAMPEDVAVYPILPGWNEVNNSGSIGTSRAMEWSDDGQKLSEGWLRSRTPTQYLTVRSRKSPARLRLAESLQGMDATNELGTKILYVAVADEDGDLFACESLDQGANAALQATDEEKVLAQLKRFIRENKPSTPTELTDESSFLAAANRRQQRRYMRNQYGLTYGFEHLADNLEDKAINNLVGTDETPLLALPPRSYVAITETAPEVTIGVPRAREEASFHVLAGNW